MPRHLSTTELTHLTIPRLQNLLKAARARAHALTYCPCCGEDMTTWTPETQEDKWLTQKSKQAWEYFENVKKELQRKQK